MLIFIGPTHGMTTGQSISLTNIISNYKKKYISLNTNYEGKSIFSKFFCFYLLYLERNKIIKAPKTVYLSIKRSFLGLLCDYFLIRKFFLNSRIVIHIHGMDINLENRSYLFNLIFKKIWNNSDAIIILSKKLKEQFKSLNKKKIYVINNYSEKILSNYEFNKKISSIYTKPLKVLFLSNILYSKGAVDVIDAFNQLKTEIQDIQLTLAGHILGDEYLTKNKLKKIIDKKLNKQISILKPVYGATKWRLLQKSDILILPTFYKSEFQPISIIEGMAFGCLIITTDQGAILDSFGAKNVIIIKKNNPQSIKEAIIKILKNPNDHKSKIINSYELIKNKFNKTKINSEIYKILN